jgi:hypothetical protein
VVWRLAVDFGTSVTTAAVMVDGEAPQILNLEQGYMPSAVFAQPDGSLLVGTSALRSALTADGALEESPKRRMEDPSGSVLLGGHRYEQRDLVAAVLEEVLFKAFYQAGGQPPANVVLTHPETWNALRLRVLRDAFNLALAALPDRFEVAGHTLTNLDSVPEPMFMSEPVAASHHFLGQATERDAKTIAVYDLGGGTFDAAVVRKNVEGRLEVLSSGGDPELGGIDFDAALFNFVGHTRVEPADPEIWRRLSDPDQADRIWRQRSQTLLNEARFAKENLTTKSETSCALPGELDLHSVLITQREFWDLIEPRIVEANDTLSTTIDRSGVEIEDLSGVWLVGGSSMIPLVANLLRQSVHPEVNFGGGDPREVVVRGALASLRSIHALGRKQYRQPDDAAKVCFLGVWRWDADSQLVGGPAVLVLTQTHLIVVGLEAESWIKLGADAWIHVSDFDSERTFNFENGLSCMGGCLVTIPDGAGGSMNFFRNVRPSHRPRPDDYFDKWSSASFVDSFTEANARAAFEPPVAELNKDSTQDRPPKVEEELAPMSLITLNGASGSFAIGGMVSRNSTARQSVGRGNWLAQGSSPTKWQELLKPVIDKKAGIAVFMLPLPASLAGRCWVVAARSKAKAGTDLLPKWLFSSYASALVTPVLYEEKARHVLILRDGRMAALRKRFVEIVRANANGCAFLNPGTAVALGRSTKEWREVFNGIALGSGVLILRLSDQSEELWTFYGRGSEQTREWLRGNA